MSKSAFYPVSKHSWSGLSVSDRAALLKDLGFVGEEAERGFQGKKVESVLRTTMRYLPGEVRLRLFMASTADGFSKEEYQRVMDETTLQQYEHLRGLACGVER